MSKCEICHYPDGQHSKNCSVVLQSELDAYKIALKYFVDNGGHGASDIANNLLRDVTHG